jgi:hypothetical protein
VNRHSPGNRQDPAAAVESRDGRKVVGGTCTFAGVPKVFGSTRMLVRLGFRQVKNEIGKRACN